MQRLLNQRIASTTSDSIYFSNHRTTAGHFLDTKHLPAPYYALIQLFSVRRGSLKQRRYFMLIKFKIAE